MGRLDAGMGCEGWMSWPKMCMSSSSKKCKAQADKIPEWNVKEFKQHGLSEWGKWMGIWSVSQAKTSLTTLPKGKTNLPLPMCKR